MVKKGGVQSIVLTAIIILFVAGLSLQLFNGYDDITGNLMRADERGCLDDPGMCARGSYCNPQTRICTEKRDAETRCSKNNDCKSGSCKPDFNNKKWCECNDVSSPCGSITNGVAIEYSLYCNTFDIIDVASESLIEVPGAVYGRCSRKRELGVLCRADKECESEYCSPATNKCATKITPLNIRMQIAGSKANGASCKSDNECSSSYCSKSTKKCAAKITPPVIVIANKANGATCKAGSECKSKLCSNGKCVQCIQNSNCAAQSACYNNKCFRREGTTKDCTLYYDKGTNNEERVKQSKTNDVHRIASVPGYSDVCISNAKLLQYYCNGTTKFYSELAICAAGEECKNGACVAKQKGLF